MMSVLPHCRPRRVARRPVISRLLLVGLMFFASAPVVRAGVDPLNLPLPVVGSVPGVETAWIARHMVENGVPMSIRSFKARMPIDQVLKRYRDLLLNHGAKHAVITPSPSVNTLAAGMGPFFVSIQGANKRGYQSAGYIVVSLMPGLVQPSKETTLPIPEAARVISVRRYRDGARQGESVTLASVKPPQDMIAAIVDIYSDAGWQRLDPPEKTAAGRVATLIFQRDNEYVQAAVGRDRRTATGGSLILINRIQEP